jgi:hypothetical protein
MVMSAGDSVNLIMRKYNDYVNRSAAAKAGAIAALLAQTVAQIDNMGEAGYVDTGDAYVSTLNPFPFVYMPATIYVPKVTIV